MNKAIFRRCFAVLLCALLAFGGASAPVASAECAHQWTQSSVVAPTCTEDGYTEFTCALCGAVKQENIRPATGHSFGEPTVIEVATCTADGSTGRLCDLCGVVEYETPIPALGHNFVEGVCTRCGACQNGVSTWAQLQQALQMGGDITLADDITAGADDTALTIPAEAQVTLHLNEKTVDRNMEAPAVDGSVFVVLGGLTLSGDGVITGGNALGSGGGVHVMGGSLTLAGGEITGNQAANLGGGVCVTGEGAAFSMTGGSIAGSAALSLTGGLITGNTASINGGGLWLGGDESSLTLTGGSVTTNTAAKQGGGVYLDGAGAFSLNGADVSGNNAYAGADIGASSGAYATLFDVTVSADIENGTVTASPAAARQGETVTLIPTPDIADAEYELSELTVTAGETVIDVTAEADGTYTFVMPGDYVSVSAEFVLLYHVYTGISLYNAHEGEPHGCTLSADRDLAAEGDTVTLTLSLEPGYELMTNASGDAIDINHEYGLETWVDYATFTFVMPGEDVEAWAYIQKAEYLVTLEAGSPSGVEFMVENGEYVYDYAPRPANCGDLVRVRYMRTSEAAIQAMAYTWTENGVRHTEDIDFEFDTSDGYYYGAFIMPNGSASVRVEFENLYTITEDWEHMQNSIGVSDKPHAITGETVTLLGQPDEACEFVEWFVYCSDTRIPTTPGENCSATFVMPKGDVTFYAVSVRVFFEVFVDSSVRCETVQFIGNAWGREGDEIRFTVEPEDYLAVVSVSMQYGGSTYGLEPDAEGVYSFSMPAENVVISAAMELKETWDALRQAVQAGGTITLTHDYTATESDEALVVPSGVSVILDLNGHTIDAYELEQNYVLEIYGNLTLEDSGSYGNIAGSDCYSTVYDCGTFTMNGGSVTGYGDRYGSVYVEIFCHFTLNDGYIYNTDGMQVLAIGGIADLNGGTIYGSSDDIVFAIDALLTVTGGAVSGYPGENGHGIHLYSSNIEISGSFSVDHDVHVGEGSVIEVSRTLSEDVVLDISMSTPGVFAKGLLHSLEESELAHFAPANSNYAIRYTTTKDGIFETNGAAELYWLHEGFTPVNTWDDLELGLMRKGGKYLLSKDIAASASNSFMGIPKGCNATVDLNGHTIDAGNLNDSYVFIIEGSLTLTDSQGGGRILFFDELTGGVRIQGGDFIMDGGYIDAWGSRGVTVMSGNFTLNGGTIESAGGASTVSMHGGVFTMNGGEVLGGDVGEGVYVRSGAQFTLEGGKVNGTWTRYASVYVSSGGVFMMNGGEVNGGGTNKAVLTLGQATMNGGRIKSTNNINAVWVADNESAGTAGTFTLRGGTITGFGNKHAIRVNPTAQFIISGSPVITPNALANVLLKSGAMLTVDGALSGDLAITVEMESPGVFTRKAGYTLTQEDIARFSCCDPAWGVRMNAAGQGELYARDRYTVTFAPGEGSGEMEDQTAYDGVPFVLPACGFTAPEGMVFSAWSVSAGGAVATYPENAQVSLTSDAAVTALWEADITGPVLALPASLTVIGEEAFSGDTSLFEVVLPDTVTRIESKAFAGSSVKRINLPESLVYIAEDAFEGCSLERVSAHGECAEAWLAAHSGN